MASSPASEMNPVRADQNESALRTGTDLRSSRRTRGILSRPRGRVRRSGSDLQCSLVDWTPHGGRERNGRSIGVHVPARSHLSNPFSTSASGSQFRQLLRAGTSHLHRMDPPSAEPEPRRSVWRRFARLSAAAWPAAGSCHCSGRNAPPGALDPCCLEAFDVSALASVNQVVELEFHPECVVVGNCHGGIASEFPTVPLAQCHKCRWARVARWADCTSEHQTGRGSLFYVPTVVMWLASAANQGSIWWPKAVTARSTTMAMVANSSPYSTASCAR